MPGSSVRPDPDGLLQRLVRLQVHRRAHHLLVVRALRLRVATVGVDVQPAVQVQTQNGK